MNRPCQAASACGVIVLLLLFAASTSGQDVYRQIVELQNRARAAGANDGSLSDHTESLRLATQLKRPRLIAVLFARLGQTYENRGEVQNAVTAYEAGLKALAEDAAFDVRQDLAALGLVGKGYGGAAPTVAALYSDELAEDLAAAERDEGLAVSLLIRVGNAYLQQPQPDPARNAYERALQRREIASMPRLRGYALANLGEALRRLGERDRAELLLMEALTVLRASAPEVESRRALALLAGVHRDARRFDQSLSTYSQALALYQQERDERGEGRTYAGLGLLHLEMRRFGDARAAFERSVQLGERVADPELLWHAYWGLGVALRSLGDLEAAAPFLEKSLDIIERRQQELRTDEGKVSLLDSAQQAYDELIKVHLDAASSPQHDRAALALAERARARALGDLLGSAPRVSFSCFETVNTIERGRPFEQRAPGVRSVVVRVADPRCADVPAIVPCPDPAPPVNSPVQAAPGVPSGPAARGDCAPPPPPPAEAPPPLARLVFHVLDDRVAIFAVAASGEIRTHEARLTREMLERRVADLRDALGVDGAGRGIRPTAGTPAAGNGDYLGKLQQLYDELVAPVAPVLGADQTLVIEPQGPLWLVPFAALRTADGGWMGDRWRLVYAPSSQSLDDIRREPPFKRTDLKALIVGNPLPPAMQSTEDLFRGGRVRAEFSPLPGAEAEARTIGGLLPETRRTVLVGPGATRDAVTSSLGSFTVLHLATHALASASQPLDSFVMLASTSQDDGRLTAREIMNLSLRTDLVTLSACQTGLGQLSGDGVIGLTRAFLVRGARSVVVSQWSVSDEATSSLMSQFYRTYFDGTGDKAQALTLAARRVRENGYEHPKYWAAFMLVGSER